MAGELCYRKGGNDLAYSKGGGGQLIYKAGVPGDVIVTFAASVQQVGPIHGCGNTHQVVINGLGTVGGNSIGSGSSACDGSVRTFQFSPASNPVTATFSMTTMSSGCTYPENNPSISVIVTATNKNTGFSKSKTVQVPNVATGSFSVTVTTDANGKVSEVQ